MIGQTDPRGGRRDQHDRTAPLPHGFGSRRHHRECGRQIGRDDGIPVLEAGQMCRLQQERTDTVRHPIEASESFDDLRDHRLDSGRLMDVKTPLGSVQLPGQLVETIRWPACQGHSGPGSAQSAAHFRPDPARSAKDQLHGGFVWNVAGHVAVRLKNCGVSTKVLHTFRASA